MALRKSSLPKDVVEQEIQFSVDRLIISHKKWYERRVVKEEEEAERQVRRAYFNLSIKSSFPFDLSNFFPTDSNYEETSSQLRFLHYPPMHLSNFFYANLVNHYRSIELVISLISQPSWNHTDPWRLNYAIDLCRTHAALGAERNSLTTGKIWGLFLSGVIFGGKDAHPVCGPYPSRD
jgi:hypothetical protein